jgi:hypothetical protein
MLEGFTIFHGTKRSTVHWYDDSGDWLFWVDLDDNGQPEPTFYKEKSEESLPKAFDLNAPRHAKFKQALLEYLGDGAVWAEGRAQVARERVEAEAASLRHFRTSLIDIFRKFRRPDFVAIVTWLTDEQLRTMRSIWQERCR